MLWWDKRPQKERTGMTAITQIRAMVLAMMILAQGAALSACGFKPMYGQNSGAAVSTTTAFKTVDIVNIPDRNGQMLRNNLVDRMTPRGASSAPVYKLNVINLQESIRGLDVTVRSDTTREQMKISGTLVFTDVASGEILMEKPLSVRGSYNILESEYTSRVSRQDLREDLIEKLARQIERSVAVYLTE